MRKSLTYLFVILAIVVAIITLLLSNNLVKKMAEEERVKIEIWAMATESMATDDNADLLIGLKILQSNNTIPVIIYDESSGLMQSHNIKLPQKDSDIFLQSKIAKFSQRHDPIRLIETNQLLYYDDSYTLKWLQIYPFMQVIIIGLFIGLAFFALNRSGRAEQNRVWVGLSKETAHQLGTPISSLMAWIEYLKLKEVEPKLLEEIDKDVDRLKMISERFSKIGAEEDLNSVDLVGFLNESIGYMKRRVSNEVKINLNFIGQALSPKPLMVLLNEPLFSWVIENIIKNGVDAMQGEGVIDFAVSENNKNVHIDITDSGKGISKSKYNTVFNTGYTTKARGWGLGLSLVKRIVEVNHSGKIFVKESVLGSGTTFRIVLRKF